MTTIAYKDGVLAADSLVAGADTRWGDTAKIARREHPHDNVMGGASGAASAAAEFLNWITTSVGLHPPCVGDKSEFDAIVIVDDKLFCWTGSGAMFALATPFTAVGSGAKFAMGAMAAGASAEEAVRIAAEFDVYTGGRITSLSLAREEPGAKAPDSAETRA